MKSVPSNFFIGLDLGQSQDYTAECVVERKVINTDCPVVGCKEDPLVEFHVRHLKRYKLGTPYPKIVKTVEKLQKNKKLGGNAILVVDGTGVGAPVVDMFNMAGLAPYCIKIHGGDNMIREGREIRVPKRDLVMRLLVQFQKDRLKIAKGIKDADILIKELLNFKVKINPKTAHDSYAAWRESDHDDLVLAVAMAVYVAITIYAVFDYEVTKNKRDSSQISDYIDPPVNQRAGKRPICVAKKMGGWM